MAAGIGQATLAIDYKAVTYHIAFAGKIIPRQAPMFLMSHCSQCRHAELVTFLDC